MQHEPADEYLRRLAAFIRTNEKNLAESGIPRRQRQRPQATDALSIFNPLGWFGYEATPQSSYPAAKPVILSIDTHHLFYVFMRLEGLGIDVGTLDVRIDNPSRPMSYISVLPAPDRSETLSLASFRSSISGISGLSLGGGWWGRPELPSLDAELKYIYSSFTKLPALLVKAPGNKVISELANEPPNQNALPLDAFKNLQSLECVDIDPRVLLGWDRLAESLRNLKIRKSGLEDVSDIFIGAVVDDQARREGSTSRKRRRRIPCGTGRETSHVSIRLPEIVVEEVVEDPGATYGELFIPNNDGTSSPPASVELTSLKWAFLRHLSLSDNALTFFPSEVIPYLTSLTHLDLSSNLLVSIPSGLGALYNLVSLNLSDNMIDSVLGIYTNLGQVLYINLAHNRLESICGLERLAALERVDLRNNYIEECAEIGRLAVLPNISGVWVEGNPLVELEENYRVVCFDYFWKERKTILLDGAPPGLYERRNLTIAPPQQMFSTRPPSAAYSVPVSVGQSPSPTLASVDKYPTPPSSNASPQMGPVTPTPASGKPRKKRAKRIVDFEGEVKKQDGSSHQKEQSDGTVQRPHAKLNQGHLVLGREAPVLPQETQTDSSDPTTGEVLPLERASSSSTVVPTTFTTVSQERPPVRSRHSRYRTEFTPSVRGAVDLPSCEEPGESADIFSTSLGLASSGSVKKTQKSATMSRSALRRARVSASVFEPPADGAEVGGMDDIRDSGEAFRRKLEALKKDVGDGWLKVLSQSQMKSLSP